MAITAQTQHELQDHDMRKEVVKAAVDAAPTADDKKAVAAAAVDALSGDQRKELLEGMFPQSSSDRKWVYVTGFVVAGIVAVLLAVIAWQAGQDNVDAIASSLVVLATGFSSALLGGLLGAYISR